MDINIKIISGYYHNLTYDNNSYYKVILNRSEFKVVVDMDINLDDNLREEMLKSINNLEINMLFIGKSRIDDYPIFRFNTDQVIREIKIDNLLK